MRCNLIDLVNGYIIWVKFDIFKFGLKINGLCFLGYRDDLYVLVLVIVSRSMVY